MTKFSPVVIFQTWGTEAGQGAVSGTLARKFRGENVGHASIEMRFPVTAENEALIAQYCKSTDVQIPHSKRQVINSDGSIEDIYVVRFSFLPATSDPFSLNSTYTGDCVYERSGHHTTERDYQETSEFTQRRAPRRVIDIFPAASLTAKGRSLDFTTDQGKYVLNEKRIEDLQDKLRTVALLEKKINDLGDNISHIDLTLKKNKTLLLALNTLGLGELNAHSDTPIQKDFLLAVISQEKRDFYRQFNLVVKENTALKTKIIESRPEAEALYRIRQQLDNFPNSTLMTRLLHDTIEKNLDSLHTHLTSIPLETLPDELQIKMTGLIDKIEEIRSSGAAVDDLFSEAKQFTNLLADEADRLQSEKNKLEDICNRFFNDIEDYLCRGRAADGEIELPLGRELDMKSMLAQMRRIVDANFPYNLNTHNCSTTALSILHAGKAGHTFPVAPGVSATTPQTVYNSALKMRDRFCRLSIQDNFDKLESVYLANADKGATVERQVYPTVNNAIINFAAEICFPAEPQKLAFQLLSAADVKKLQKIENSPINTELLRDLWNLIPDRKLPLTENGALSVIIDKNITMGELVQGLTVLATIKAKERVSLTHIADNTNTDTPKPAASLAESNGDVYALIKQKIEEQIQVLQDKGGSKTKAKVTQLAFRYSMATHALDSATDLNDAEKAKRLLNEVLPILKINTGTGMKEPSTYLRVVEEAKRLNINMESPHYSPAKEFKDALHQMRDAAAQAPDEGPDVPDSIKPTLH